MSTPLLAPIYRTNQITCDNTDAAADFINRRYQVLKRATRGYNPDDYEIIWDSGVVPEHRMSNDTYKHAQRLAEDLNAASFQSHISGRDFTRYQTNWYVSVDEADARRQADIDKTPADKVKITPGVKILYHAGVSTLWSDGRLTKSTGLDIPPGGDITRAAWQLVRYALEAGWRKTGEWTSLLEVQSYEIETVEEYTDRTRGMGFSGTSEYKLQRLTTDAGRVLWLVSEEGGCLGEDGDAWENYELYQNEHEARIGYRRQLRGILIETLHQTARYLSQGLVLEVVQGWSSLIDWSQRVFDIELPLQHEFAAVAADPYEFDRDEHGWAMYLKGFADALAQ